jgi:hypothetical protein
MTIPAGLLDLLRYMLLCFLWILAGRGLLRLAKRQVLGPTGWLLAPAVTQAAVAVALGMSAVLGSPIRNVSTGLWTVTAVLAVLGLPFEWTRPGKRDAGIAFPSTQTRWMVCLAILVPVFVLLPYFFHAFGRYLGSPHPDGWSYTVYGAYLWEYPRGTYGGLAPVYEWASHLSQTRHVASAELAWLATATREGDTQAAVGLLLALTIFTISSTCAALGRIIGLRRGLLGLYVVAAGGGTWIWHAISVSNLDNLLALAYLPALAAVALDRPTSSKFGGAVVAGVLAAGLLYTYPEFAILLLSCSGLFFLQRVRKMPVRQSLMSAVVFTVTTGALIWPYGPDLAAFLRNQLASGLAAGTLRPGEGTFAGLVNPKLHLAAFWGLASHNETRDLLWARYILAGGLDVLALLGVWALARRRAWAALGTLVLVLAGFSTLVWVYHYSYGAYKFIILGWWLLTLVVVLGIRECSKVHPAIVLLAVVLGTGTFLPKALRSTRLAFAQPGHTMEAMRAVRHVSQLADGAPVALVVSDDTAAHWATYFLRDIKVRVVAVSGYLAMPHVLPALLRAAPVPWGSLRLLLTDATDHGPVVETQGWKLLWRNDTYALWDTEDRGWIAVWSIDHPYGIDGNEGHRRIWIGDEPTRLFAAANTDGIAILRGRFVADRPLPDAVRPARVLTTDGTGSRCDRSVDESATSLPLFVKAGDNLLALVKSWPPSRDVPGPDERRPLTLGLVSPTLEFRRGIPDVFAPCPSEAETFTTTR